MPLGPIGAVGWDEPKRALHNGRSPALRPLERGRQGRPNPRCTNHLFRAQETNRIVKEAKSSALHLKLFL